MRWIAIHAGSGIERGQFGGVELVLDDEAAVLDAPEPLPGAQSRQETLLGAGEPERGGGGAELVGLLPVDDPGLRVRQQRVRQSTVR